MIRLPGAKMLGGKVPFSRNYPIDTFIIKKKTQISKLNCRLSTIYITLITNRNLRRSLYITRPSIDFIYKLLLVEMSYVIIYIYITSIHTYNISATNCVKRKLIPN